jgi:Spy/CpxP family protein refolding chaperone
MLHTTPGDLMNLNPRTLMPSLSRPVQMLLATLMVAAAAGLSQPVHAQPMGPMHGGPDGPGGMQGAMHGGMHGGGVGMGMGMGMGMGGASMGRVLDAVKATPEQRTQIKTIMEAARGDLKAQHEAGRGLHQQMQAAFAQPTVDARAVEGLRLQIVAQHDAASKRITQALLDASKVLTAEQRKTVADMMAKRQAMMQRHASERATLDKSTK